MNAGEPGSVPQHIASALAAERWPGDYALAVDGGQLSLGGRDWVVIATAIAAAVEAGDDLAAPLLARILLQPHQVGTLSDPRHPDWSPDRLGVAPQ